MFTRVGSDLFYQLCHKMLCTLWDPIVFTSVEYIKLNGLSLRAWRANCVYKSGLRPILSIVSQDAMHTLGSHCVYIRGIHQIKWFVSKGVTCKLCLQEWAQDYFINCVRGCYAYFGIPSMEYIKLNRLSVRPWRANYVYKSGIHKIGAFVS